MSTPPQAMWQPIAMHNNSSQRAQQLPAVSASAAAAASSGGSGVVRSKFFLPLSFTPSSSSTSAVPAARPPTAATAAGGSAESDLSEPEEQQQVVRRQRRGAQKKGEQKRASAGAPAQRQRAHTAAALLVTPTRVPLAAALSSAAIATGSIPSPDHSLLDDEFSELRQLPARAPPAVRVIPPTSSRARPLDPTKRGWIAIPTSPRAAKPVRVAAPQQQLSVTASPSATAAASFSAPPLLPSIDFRQPFVLDAVRELTGKDVHFRRQAGSTTTGAEAKQAESEPAHAAAASSTDTHHTSVTLQYSRLHGRKRTAATKAAPITAASFEHGAATAAAAASEAQPEASPDVVEIDASGAVIVAGADAEAASNDDTDEEKWPILDDLRRPHSDEMVAALRHSKRRCLSRLTSQQQADYARQQRSLRQRTQPLRKFFASPAEQVHTAAQLADVSSDEEDSDAAATAATGRDMVELLDSDSEQPLEASSSDAEDLDSPLFNPPDLPSSAAAHTHSLPAWRKATRSGGHTQTQRAHGTHGRSRSKRAAKAASSKKKQSKRSPVETAPITTRNSKQRAASQMASAVPPKTRLQKKGASTAAAATTKTRSKRKRAEISSSDSSDSDSDDSSSSGESSSDASSSSESDSSDETVTDRDSPDPPPSKHARHQRSSTMAARTRSKHTTVSPAPRTRQSMRGARAKSATPATRKAKVKPVPVPPPPRPKPPAKAWRYGRPVDAPRTQRQRQRQRQRQAQSQTARAAAAPLMRKAPVVIVDESSDDEDVRVTLAKMRAQRGVVHGTTSGDTLSAAQQPSSDMLVSPRGEPHQTITVAVVPAQSRESATSVSMPAAATCASVGMIVDSPLPPDSAELDAQLEHGHDSDAELESQSSPLPLAAHARPTLGIHGADRDQIDVTIEPPVGVLSDRDEIEADRDDEEMVDHDTSMRAPQPDLQPRANSQVGEVSQSPLSAPAMDSSG